MVMNIDGHTKMFGPFSEDDQDLFKHFQGVLGVFLRSMLLRKASLAVCYCRCQDFKSTHEFFQHERALENPGWLKKSIRTRSY